MYWFLCDESNLNVSYCFEGLLLTLDCFLSIYLQQCTTDDDPFQFIRDYQEEIVSTIVVPRHCFCAVECCRSSQCHHPSFPPQDMAKDTVANLSESLESVSVERLNLICGQDFGPFESLLDTMAGNLQILSDNARDALSLLSCERIVPLYVNSVYGATCTYSINGVTWTWSAFLVVATMGMIMIMFRSAYLPNSNKFVDHDVSSLEEDDYEDDPVQKSYLPQMTYPSSGEASPDEEDDDDHSTSDLSSVYMYGTNYQVSFDENSQVGR